MIRLINPSTEQVTGEFTDDSPEQIEAKLFSSASAFDFWRKTSLEERAACVRAAGLALRRRRAELGTMMAREMGKPMTAGESEIDKCAGACEFFADHASEFLKPRIIQSDAGRSRVQYDPIGPVLAIMPWNFPFWQVIRFAAPALMAGNVGVLKHAPNVPDCAQALEEAFAEGGCPPGVFTSLRISDNATAERVVGHRAIRAVTLTGSERAGSVVSAAAGRALKKTVMELGGSDAFIVLKDADVQAVAESAAMARCINSGQSCIAAKRFIIEAPILADFQAALVVAMKRRKVGDPLDRQTDLGPLARRDLMEGLDRQVQASVSAGARLLTGGKRWGAVGYFYEPTVLGEVRPGMAVFDEETFGPVAAVISASDPADAVRLANLSVYGLGSSIWTRDIELAERLAANLDSGAVFINGIVHSDPRLPFGGVKQSGWGRELSREGIHEFVNIKTVWIK